MDIISLVFFVPLFYNSTDGSRHVGDDWRLYGLDVSEKKELTKEEKDRQVRVANMFGAFDKLIRGMKLYEGKGPLVEKLLASAKQRVDAALVDGDIVSKITPIGPIYLGEPCIEGDAPKYLFQLFCDGVRELTFRQGVPETELLTLAEVLNADLSESQDDMVTHLWKQELKFIRYYAVDTLGVQVDDSGELSLAANQEQQLASVDQGQDMTLSSSDMRLLKSQNKLNWVRSCKAPPLATGSLAESTRLLTRAIEKTQDIQRFVAIALRVSEKGEAHPMLLNLLQSYIGKGDADSVSKLLEALAQIGTDGHSEAAKLLNQSLSEETLVALAPLYSDNSTSFIEAFNLALKLDSFSPQQLVVLLKHSDIGEARVKLQKMLGDAGVDLTPFYVDALSSEIDEVVMDAIGALGKIGSDMAIEALAKALSNHLTEVRKAAMKAMSGRYTDKVKTPLVKALKDPDAEIRIAALSVLSGAGDRMIGSSLLGVMQGPDFYRREEEEVAAFFEALSAFPSPSSLGFINKLLTEKNLTRSKAIVSRQLLAVKSLSKMDSPDAKPALEQCAKRWFLPSDVKSAAKSAIQNKK